MKSVTTSFSQQQSSNHGSAAMTNEFVIAADKGTRGPAGNAMSSIQPGRATCLLLGPTGVAAEATIIRSNLPDNHVISLLAGVRSS